MIHGEEDVEDRASKEDNSSLSPLPTGHFSQQSIKWSRQQGSWEKQRWLNSGHPKLAEKEGGSAGRKRASMWYPFLLIFSLQVAEFSPLFLVCFDQ